MVTPITYCTRGYFFQYNVLGRCVNGVVSDFVERGRTARPRAKLGRSWHAELAGGVP